MKKTLFAILTVSTLFSFNVSATESKEASEVNESNSTPVFSYFETEIVKTCNNIVTGSTRLSKHVSIYDKDAMEAICLAIFVQETTFVSKKFLLPKNELWALCNKIEYSYNMQAESLNLKEFNTIATSCVRHNLKNNSISSVSYVKQNKEAKDVYITATAKKSLLIEKERKVNKAYLEAQKKSIDIHNENIKNSFPELSLRDDCTKEHPNGTIIEVSKNCFK